MIYWPMLPTPLAPHVHVVTVKGPITGFKSPQVFLMAALLGNGLAITNWTQQFTNGALNNPALLPRLQQLHNTQNSNVYYTLSASPNGYQMDFYI